MFCGWILLVFLLLLCPGQSRCALDYPPDGSKAQYKHFEKRYDDVDYDSFIGLMGRRSTGPNHSTNSSFRNNMNDIFVGLLGRRNTMSAVPAWRGERKGNFFSKDRRLRGFGVISCCAFFS